MLPCPSCHRHVRETDSACPFCGTEQRRTPPILGHVGAFAFSVMLLGSTGCGKDPSPATSNTAGETTHIGSTSSDTSTESSGSTLTNTGDTTSNTSNSSGSFYAGPDVDFSGFNNCDPWLQDCPEGEKCVAYASTGGDWDANRCVPVTGAGAPGDPCVYSGPIEATDDCDESSYCWNVDDMHIGTCLAFCTGLPEMPECPIGSDCMISGEGSINLCVDTCDPIGQDCNDGFACYWAGAFFECIMTTMDIPPGEACGFLNDCAGGLACVAAGLLPSCLGDSCCAAFCDVNDIAACPDPNLECVPFFDQGQAPVGYEHIGVCGVPGP